MASSSSWCFLIILLHNEINSRDNSLSLFMQIMPNEMRWEFIRSRDIITNIHFMFSINKSTSNQCSLLLFSTRRSFRWTSQIRQHHSLTAAEDRVRSDQNLLCCCCVLICSQIETVLLFGIYTFGVITCPTTRGEMNGRLRRVSCKVAEAFVGEQRLNWVLQTNLNESRRGRLDCHCWDGPSFGEHFSLHVKRKKELTTEDHVVFGIQVLFTSTASFNRPSPYHTIDLLHSWWK